MLGVIDHKLLLEYRRYAIVALAILAAIVTPPDAISMMMMLVPLVLLYEISIWVVKFVGKSKSVTPKS
jgi:sec-independent protein translocase protein TatC